MQPDVLSELRDDVDGINRQIVALLATRHQLTSEIGRRKSELGLPICVPAREGEVLARVAADAADHALDWRLAQPVFEAILEVSKQSQQVDRLPGA